MKTNSKSTPLSKPFLKVAVDNLSPRFQKYAKKLVAKTRRFSGFKAKKSDLDEVVVKAMSRLHDAGMSFRACETLANLSPRNGWSAMELITKYDAKHKTKRKYRKSAEPTSEPVVEQPSITASATPETTAKALANVPEVVETVNVPPVVAPVVQESAEDDVEVEAEDFVTIQ